MRTCITVCLVSVASLAASARVEAQLGNLISPGKLARAHTSLEGLLNCQKCHEQGRKVTVEKCLACHKPIADRMAKRVGVHRDVKGDCVMCHAEHAGLDGELRPFDTRQFDHARVTGFGLDGKHARVAADCTACHKSRSFLAASANCASCHTDVHKGTLGKDCAACHSSQVGFKELGGRFDHQKSAFPLLGAHRTVTCASCHRNNVFKGVRFASCTDCHRDPHRQSSGTTCTACHTNDSWRTKKVDHARTAFPLVGRHVGVECAACHKQPPMKVKPRADTCAACHNDVHRGAFRQDCKACHAETGFEKTPFDHTKTTFALTGKHATTSCTACHANVAAGKVPAARRVVDFRGLKTACVSCHRDVHTGELGVSCEACHSSSSFRVTNYVHQRAPEFFKGQHAPLACGKCHVLGAPTRPVRTGEPTVALAAFKSASTRCTSCHADVHLGQEGAACETCHSVQIPKFATAGFSHEKTAFALTGRHQTVMCVQCHKRETGLFPVGRGTAVRYKGMSGECQACHMDVHLGQLTGTGLCGTCHVTTSFKVSRYAHRGRAVLVSGFFLGRHASAPCQACHKTVVAQFPSGRGTAIQFKVDARCVNCHTDVHRGSLGPNCVDCHKP